LFKKFFYLFTTGIFTAPSVNRQGTQIHWMRSFRRILFACCYLLRRSRTLLAACNPCRLDGHKVTYCTYMNPFMNVCWKTGYPWHNPICSESWTVFMIHCLTIIDKLKSETRVQKFGNFRRKLSHMRLNLLMINHNHNIHYQAGSVFLNKQ